MRALRWSFIAVSVRIGAALLAIGAFVALTHELVERDVDAIDRALLLGVATARRWWLNGVAVDVTALGSATVLTACAVFAVLVLIALRRRAAAIQLVLASTGAAVLTTIAKHVIERQRPTVVPRLVEVTGFSYPSGHSVASSAVYLTLALIASRELARARRVIHAAGAVVVGAVALSRIYLGVHFPSDVVSGICIGAGWALIIDAVGVGLTTDDANP
jgi:membrane-associated phospholipid phosphatase